MSLRKDNQFRCIIFSDENFLDKKETIIKLLCSELSGIQKKARNQFERLI